MSTYSLLVMKILAVIDGIFLAVFMYLESQGIMAINWDKLQGISQGILSTIQIWHQQDKLVVTQYR
jgi:uncharacterized membrane protein (Fun14 family)